MTGEDAPEKVFTPKEANQTLPLVKQIVADILTTGDRVRALCAEIGTGAEEDKRVIRLMDQLEELFVELDTLGCSYKDWNFQVGLVDFPARIDGKDVFLCWKSDEDSLLYYHELEAGFNGRQPIPERYLKA